MLDVRYDARGRVALVRVREGRAVRTRTLSPQAVGDYDGRGRLVAITVEDIDETAAEFLRTADEETLLRVIAAIAGRSKAGTARPGEAPAAGDGKARAKAKPRAKPRPAAKPKDGARPKGGAKPKGAGPARGAGRGVG